MPIPAPIRVKISPQERRALKYSIVRRYGPMTMLERLAQMLQGIVTALDARSFSRCDTGLLLPQYPGRKRHPDCHTVDRRDMGRMSYYVAMTTLGSILGCLALYTVGRKGEAPC